MHQNIRAVLTVVNQNRRDIRLVKVEFRTDPAIVVSLDTNDARDIIRAAFERSRKGGAAPQTIDLHDKHVVVEGSSIGVAASRFKIPLDLTAFGDRKYTAEIATLTATVRYELLDSRHIEGVIQAQATVPFRCA